MAFTENYSTKSGQEIQAFHFGRYADLHTVVVYLKDTVKSYCTVSTNVSHSSAAIWTHLQTIFNECHMWPKTCIFWVMDQSPNTGLKPCFTLWPQSSQRASTYTQVYLELSGEWPWIMRIRFKIFCFFILYILNFKHPKVC